MTTSEMIKKLCDVKNISLSELARRLGQSPQNFGKKLKRETVTLEELLQIAELTGVSFEQNFVLENGDRISTGDKKNTDTSKKNRKSVASEGNIRRILQNISHELRTPLNTIVGFADMLPNIKDNHAKLMDYIDKIKYSADHITKMVDNMTEMATLNENVENSTTLVDAQNVFDNFTEYISDYANKKKVKFNYEFKSMGNARFYCDAQKLNKVIKIILSNAVRFAPQGGCVDMILDRFDIKDNGKIGIRCVITNTVDKIAPKIYDKICSILNDDLDPYEWMDYNAEQLEVAIVKKSIEDLGGSIMINTDDVNGTKAVIEFIFNNAETEQEDSNPEGALEGKKILVVEDNELNREILRELLGIVGITTEVAEDGLDAVERFQRVGKNYYDAVLMDIQMPRMDGYEATRRIREICGDRKIPIIAVTANAFDEDRQKSLECGLDAHMSKPVDYNKLLVLLKKFMLAKR